MNTYTFTARNKINPDKVLTFTLQGDFLKVHLTGLEDSLTDRIGNQEDLDSLKSGIFKQAGPIAVKVMEEISGPVHVHDVQVNLGDSDGNRFKVTFWKRLAGLRVAPVILDMGQVDNPQAARRFADELKARQESTGKSVPLFGPLDYWLGWIGLGAILMFAFRKLTDRRSNSD